MWNYWEDVFLHALFAQLYKCFGFLNVAEIKISLFLSLKLWYFMNLHAEEISSSVINVYAIMKIFPYLRPFHVIILNLFLFLFYFLFLLYIGYSNYGSHSHTVSYCQLSYNSELIFLLDKIISFLKISQIIFKRTFKIMNTS